MKTNARVIDIYLQVAKYYELFQSVYSAIIKETTLQRRVSRYKLHYLIKRLPGVIQAVPDFNSLRTLSSPWHAAWGSR